MAPEAQASVTAVVVNHNAGELLSRCLQTLQQQAEIVQTVVIDNASSDRSMQSIEGWQAGWLKCIKNTANQGFAQACNQGAECAKTSHILFANPDTEAPDGAVGTLLQALNEHTNAALAGCFVTNMDGSEQRGTRRRLPNFWRVLKTWSGLERLSAHSAMLAGLNLNHLPPPRGVQLVEAVNGAFFLVRKDCFDAVQGFDAGYPLHFEDLDLFKRVQNQGWDVLLCPQVQVRHHKGASSTDVERVHAWKKAGLRRYFSKHQSRLAAWLVRRLT